MSITAIIRRMLERERFSSRTYTDYLRKKGVRIGDGTWFYSPKSVDIDITRPYLIELGNNVHITRGVVMLTHGYDWGVLREKYHEMIGSAGKITIGNNVFIGADTTILKGVTIGNNVIIGAKSLINKDIPSDCVVAGVPARFISDLETFRQKKTEECVKEAKLTIKEYYRCYGKYLPVEEMYEFFWLFEKRDPNKAMGYSHAGFNKRMRDRGLYREMEERYYETNARYDSYEELVRECIMEVEGVKDEIVSFHRGL